MASMILLRAGTRLKMRRILRICAGGVRARKREWERERE